jgi:hypothetical protein
VGSELLHFISKSALSKKLDPPPDEINNAVKENEGEPKATKNLLRQKIKMKYHSFL